MAKMSLGLGSETDKTPMNRIKQILTLPIKARFRKFVSLHPLLILCQKKSGSLPEKKSCQNTESSAIWKPQCNCLLWTGSRAAVDNTLKANRVPLSWDEHSSVTGCGHSIERPLKPPFMICQNKPPISPHKTSFTSAHSERTHKHKKHKKTRQKMCRINKNNASALPPPLSHSQIWLRTLATVTQNRGTSSIQPLQTVTSSGVETRGHAWGGCDWFKMLARSSAWRSEGTQIPVCWATTLDHSCSHKLLPLQKTQSLKLLKGRIRHAFWDLGGGASYNL